MVKKSNLDIIEKYRENRLSLGLSLNTIKNAISTITKLAKHIENKNLRNASTEDLQSMFKEIEDCDARDTYASRIITFYKWLLNLKEGDGRSKNMEWFKYSTKKDRRRQKNPNIKDELIEPEEYEKIIQHVKMDLRMSALYETLYLSGGRPDEICKLKIKNVENDNGKISIIIENSKTDPRTVPLTEKPSLLLRWLENHPYKKNKNAWLFFSLDRRYKNNPRPITASSVSDKFKKLKEKLNLKSKEELNLKPSLILYSFRKTRATEMFNQDYDDKEMGALFGWEPHTVIDRRNEYDLRDLDDLKAKIFNKAEKYKTREELEEENKEFVENYNVKIDRLKEEHKKEQEHQRNHINRMEAELHELKEQQYAQTQVDTRELLKESMKAQISILKKQGIDTSKLEALI